MTFDFGRVKKAQETSPNNSLINKAGVFNAPNIHTNTKAQHVEKAVLEMGLNDISQVIGYKSAFDDKQALINLKNQNIMDQELANELLSIKKCMSDVQMEMQVKNALGFPTPIEKTSSYKRLMQKTKGYNSVDWAAWIPTTFTSFQWEELEVPMSLANLFPTFNMSSKTQEIPLSTDFLEGQLEEETGAFSEQSTSVDKMSMTVKNNVVHVKMWEDFLQDNIDPQVFQKQRFNTAMALVRSFENCLLNGDTTATHMDSNVTSAKDFRRAFNGLRKIALLNSGNGVVVNCGGDQISLTDIQAMMANKAVEANYDALRWVLPTYIYDSINTGMIPEFLMVQNVVQAGTLTSMESSLFGIPKYRAGKLPSNLNANAIHDGVVTDLTALFLVDTSRFVIGNRTGIRFWVTPSLANSDSIMCTAKQRHTFGCVPQGVKEKSVVMARNVKGGM